MTSNAETVTKQRPGRARPLVLFDGGCPLCRREISHYQRVEGASNIEWIDISTAGDLQQHFGVDYESAMRRFHVRTAHGEWLTGAYAFAELWSQLRGYRYLTSAVRAARILPAIDWAYRKFADWRLERRRCGGADTGIPLQPLQRPPGALS